jgi:YD repeat-containing protein
LRYTPSDGPGLFWRPFNQGATFTDHEGAVVRATTDYEYDGLNNLIRVIRRGRNDSSEADDRIQQFSYGPGGRLRTQTDAEGHFTTLDHDAAGNVTLRRLVRRDADGQAVTEATAHSYDALNRELRRQNLWQAGDTFETRYNAWGEVTGRRTNGGNAAGEWQEYAEYNALGRVEKTNAGNATVSFASAGADLRSMNLAQVPASPTIPPHDHAVRRTEHRMHAGATSRTSAAMSATWHPQCPRAPLRRPWLKPKEAPTMRLRSTHDEQPSHRPSATPRSPDRHIRSCGGHSSAPLESTTGRSRFDSTPAGGGRRQRRPGGALSCASGTSRLSRGPAGRRGGRPRPARRPSAAAQPRGTYPGRLLRPTGTGARPALSGPGEPGGGRLAG